MNLKPFDGDNLRDGHFETAWKWNEIGTVNKKKKKQLYYSGPYRWKGLYRVRIINVSMDSVRTVDLID